MFLQAVEYHAEVGPVLVRVSTGNEQVVDVYEDKVESPHDLVHVPLECLSTVTEAERHKVPLVQTKWSYDGCLRDVTWLDRDLVVCLQEIDGREYCLSM